MIQFGASPRASIYLIECGRALAYLRGRDYVLPEDVTDVALDVMRHRIVLSYDAMAEELSADEVLGRILRSVPAPGKVLQSHVRLSANA
jgi:MoxR-like ATPase